MSSRLIKSICLSAAVSAVVLTSSNSLGQTTYLGANNGDWATGANWSAGVPNGATNAIINGAVTLVNVNLAAGTTGNVANLTIDAGDSLTLLNNSTLNIGGNLIGGGTLRFASNGNESFLNFSSATASIASGTLVDLNYLTGSSTAGVIQGPGTGTLTNSGTIRGIGSLRNIRFTNAATGIVDANDSRVGSLYLDASNGGAGLFINLGTIRATNGGGVTFAGDFGGDFISTNGNIQANGAGSIVRVNNSPSITGGHYSTAGGGEIRVEANQSAFLSPQSLSGTLRVGNNATLHMNGTMTNNGSIFLTTAGNASILNVNSPLTLSGTGSLVGEWSGTGAGPRIDAPSHLLTIGANQTQSGVIYYNNSRVQNNGLIDANVASAATTGSGIIIDPNNFAAGLFVNNGTMRSSAGGLLSIAGDAGGDTINNGTISAVGTGSITELYNSAAVTGGTWSNSGGGVIRVRPGNTGFLIGPVNIPAGSKFTVPATSAQTTLDTNGTFSGNIELQANGSLPLLRLGQNTTLTSGSLLRGTYANIPSTPGARIDALGAATLTIAAGATVDGIVYFNNTRVINNGLIDSNTNFATSNGGMYVDAANASAGLFVNNATMRSSAGGLMQLTGDFGGDFINNGTISSTGTGSITELVNNVTVTGGTWTNTSGGVSRVRPGMTGTLVSPTISAGSTFVVETTATSGGTNLELRTSLNGPGVLELRSSNPGANVPVLRVFNDVTLNAGSILRGTYQTTGNGPRIDHLGGGTLTIASGATIDGVVYFNNSRVINNGTIDANIPAGMYIDANNASADLFVNNNVMRSSNGGLMVLTGDFGGNFLNNATISSTGTGSITELVNNVTVSGGTWTNTAGGVIRVRPGLNAALVNPTISAGSTFVVETTASSGQTSLQLNGTLSGPGVLEMRSTNPGGNTPVLTIASPVTVASGATINGSYLATGNGTRIDANANTLTIASGGTLRGVIYFNNSRVINNGTILSDNGSVPNTVGSFGMYIDANNSGGVLFVNNGTIRATGGGSLGFAGDFGGAFGGTGPIIADASSVVGSWNGATGDMGPVTGAGTYRAGNSANLGHVHFRVGTLEATNSATARVTAGATPGLSAGTSKVGTIAVSTNGRIDLTNNGMVVTAMTQANVRSLIAPARNGGLWNGSGIGSSLANNNGKAIGYALASDLYAAPGNFLGQSFNLTDVLVRYTFNGDTDLNGLVNFDDLLRVAQNYDTAGTGVWSRGDFNYDGNINFDDLLSLAQQYGNSLVLSDGESATLGEAGGTGFVQNWALAVSLVPEPTGLLGLAGAATTMRRRRR